MKTEKADAEYRICYRSKETGLRHTLFAKDEKGVIEVIKSLKGRLISVGRNPNLARL